MGFMPLITGNRVLPVVSSYPFDIDPSPRYELLYLWQIIAQLFLGLTFSNFGNFYMAICFLMCGQFDVLSCSLKNLRNTALLEKGIDKEELE